jgi:hypothetical protein
MPKQRNNIKSLHAGIFYTSSGKKIVPRRFIQNARRQKRKQQSVLRAKRCTSVIEVKTTVQQLPLKLQTYDDTFGWGVGGINDPATTQFCEQFAYDRATTQFCEQFAYDRATTQFCEQFASQTRSLGDFVCTPERQPDYSPYGCDSP